MKTNWQTKKLEEISTRVKDGLHKTPEYVSNGIPFISTTNLKPFSENFDFDSYKKFISQRSYEELFKTNKPKKGDILISKCGTIGIAQLIRTDLDFGIFVGLALVSLDKEIDGKYFEYYLNSPWAQKEMDNLCTGSTRKTLALQALKKLKVSFPTLPEQKRIVKILDEAFEKIEKAKKNAEKNLQNSKELFESYLQNIFANSGKDWEEKKLGDIGRVSMCKRVFKNETTRTGDIPFYKIGTFGKEPDAFISNERYNEFRKKYSFPKKGDILISASGTIGRRVRYDGEPAYFQDSNIVWIDNNEKQVLNDYLYSFYGACDWNATKGATISRLYNDNLRQIKITFPKSISEQKTIVKKIDLLSKQTEKLEKVYQKKLDDLEELKKSVLNKAFTGEL